MTTVGFLHPGAMGASLAATCRADSLWTSGGRSPETMARATEAGLEDAGSLDALCARSDIVVSICPPGAAPEVGAQVAATGFDGIFVDANAIAPTTARAIGSAQHNFVDGGVVGPPVRQAGSTRLYLAGAAAAEVAEVWRGSDLDVRVIDGEVGAASAMKVAYAAWTKGSSALLLAVRAYAEAAGVAETLEAEWEASLPGLSADVDRRATGVSPKAWRWVAEMDEIASAFEAVGLPDGFHRGAAELYDRMVDFRGADPGPDLAAVLSALLSES